LGSNSVLEEAAREKSFSYDDTTLLVSKLRNDGNTSIAGSDVVDDVAKSVVRSEDKGVVVVDSERKRIAGFIVLSALEDAIVESCWVDVEDWFLGDRLQVSEVVSDVDVDGVVLSYLTIEGDEVMTINTSSSNRGSDGWVSRSHADLDEACNIRVGFLPNLASDGSNLEGNHCCFTSLKAFVAWKNNALGRINFSIVEVGIDTWTLTVHEDIWIDLLVCLTVLVTSEYE
jgi:hypothetical protein